MPREDVLVVGGGISGLTAALHLARSGARVRVIERAARLGGLAASALFRGVACDLGSHRLHPEALTQPLFREINAREPFVESPRRGVLVLGDKRIPYPLRPATLLAALGLRESLTMALGLVSARVTARPQADDPGFEEAVTARVGRPAYEALYAPYARKVWGISPSDLSASVARARLSSSRPLSLLRSVGASRATFLYPSRGIASIIDFLAAELSKHDVTIELGRAFDRSELPGPTLYAGDLADLVDTPLTHRGLYLVHLAFAVDKLSDTETFYCPDPQRWFGRVSEVGNYAPAMRRPGETILCVEIPEGALGAGLDFASGERLAALLRQLVDARILPRGLAPIEARQTFVPRVYPLYRRGWLADWRRAMARVVALGPILPFGRPSLFLHCNLDHCADIAAAAAAHFTSGGSPAAWIDHAERFHELGVRD